VSAGIGCTPIIGMLHYLTHTTTERSVTVLHADRSPARQAHRRELAELVAALPGAALRHWYEDLGVRTATTDTMQGLIELEKVEVLPDSQAYLCGPLPFMDLVRSELLARGLPEANIHYEVFGPDKWLAGLCLTIPTYCRACRSAHLAGSGVVTGGTTGAGAPLSFMHCLHSGHRDLASLLDQHRGDRLGCRHQVRPGV
jgi:ferredoxin-NADP reductase